VPWYVTVAALVMAIFVFGAIGMILLESPDDQAPPAEPPVKVPLFLDPADVDHDPRLRFSYDPPGALTTLRLEEGLDEVVSGAASSEDAYRRLMQWTGAQWEPSTPTIYPPPDARVILKDIRSGFTGGFCGQYCFVLVQAIQSFGGRARMVTVEGHEVVESWLPDQKRWAMFDPTFVLQVHDRDGRSLNAVEIRQLWKSGDGFELTNGHRSPFDDDDYVSRFRNFAVWIRNDFMSRPMNFDDFSRYRVWYTPDPDLEMPRDSLVTLHELDLYSPPDQ